MPIEIKVRDPVVLDLFRKMSKLSAPPSYEHIEQDVKDMLQEEGDVVAAITLAKKSDFDVPKDFFELSVKRSVSTGDFVNVYCALSELGRELTQQEIISLVNKVVLKGDVVSLYSIQSFSNKVFHLSLWQNIFVIRTVRMLWENKYDSLSPLGTFSSFFPTYREIFLELRIQISSLYKSSNEEAIPFPVFNATFMHLLLHANSFLEKDRFVKGLFRKICANSPPD